MARYLLQRLSLALVVLVGLAIVTFALVHLVPGDPVRITLGSRATEESVAAATKQLGLDQPLLVQFWSFVSGAVTGDLGTSLTFNAPVSEIVGERIAPSALLIGYGLLVSLLVGVPLAILAALRPNGALDNVIRVATTFTFAMPQFWLGLMLALIFGLALGLFPVSASDYEPSLGWVLEKLTLPALTVGLPLATIVLRTLRSSLLEVLQTEYVEAARSRGLSERRIVIRHALRNAMMATITVVGVNLGFLIGQTVVVEVIFQIPGVGSLLLQGVLRRDYGLVQGLALLSGAAVVVISLLTDLAQAAADPRVRLARR